jgi:hypothetical protein
MKTPKRKCDWIGLTVCTNRPLETRSMIVPRGTICRVTHSRGGLTLKTDPCPHCGVAVFIIKVPEYDVTILGGKSNAD